MNNSFKKRAGRAAIAGATLLGLAAGGLAAAAPASAADGSGMVTGPLSTAWYAASYVVDSTGRKMEFHQQADLPAKMAAGQIAYWTYPGPDAVGTISRNGSCMVGATGINRLPVTIAKCDDTALAQKWFGQSNGTAFKLANRNANGRLLYRYEPDVTTANENSGFSDDYNFALGLQLAADYMTVAPSLTTPLPGADITPGTVFSGAAEPGTLITVLDKDGKEIGRATAGADKTWSLKLDPAPINGLIRLKVVATDTGGKATTLADDQYTMKGSDEARAYTGPTSGDITPETVFTGTGAKGETVVIKDGTGKVIGQTTVGQDGHWSTTLNPVPTNGSTDIVVEITGKNGVTEQLASETLTMTGSEEPNAYTGPTSGIVTPDTVFTGTGTKGETVTITDSEGNVLGSTVIGDDGQWSLTLDNPPVNGEHNLFVKIGDETIATPKVEMTGSDEAPGYTGPEAGAIITPDTVFTGTGGKGETVVIKDGNGNILGEGVVGDDGQWSLTLDNPPVNGDVNLVIEVGGNKVADTNVVMEGSDELPGYTGPEEGATVTPDTVFTGTGGKGETVVIKDGNGNILGEGVVGDDGQWSLKLDPAPRNGDVNLVIEVGGNKVADTNVVMEGSEDARSLKTPGVDGTITPDTVFSGNGVEGDTVVIKDSTGKVLGSVEVGADGTWSTTLNPAPANGDTDLIIEIVTKDGDTIQLADNTYEMTESVNKFEVLTPDLSKDNGSIKNGTVFTGKGAPGTTVVITDKDGTPVGQAEVDTEGNWSTPVTGMPQGPNNLTITHTAPGADPISTDLGAIVVASENEGTPLMDPAIAGGALPALLAAAGAFLGIRRRRITARQ